jgi:PAS domain S-box-containing protein
VTDHDLDTLRLAAIVDSSDDAIVSKDLNGVVTSWNAAARTMFGYTADEIVGKSIRTIIPQDRQAEEDEVLRRIRLGESVDHFETVRQRKDGSLVPISLSVSPIRDRNGKVIGISKIARDISERKQAEAETERAYEQLQTANRLKDEFLATLSHELRTPLNAVLGYARMLRSGAVSADRVPLALEVMERNATSLTQIVEDVLDVSRIISGKVRLNVQTVDLPTVLNHAVETVAHAADAKRIRLQCTIDPVGPVSGDPDRLQQVAWNLLTNAVKFTPRDGRIQVRLERVNSQVEIVVSDTGIGIQPEFLPHIFERFRQAESGTTRVHGGLGLGLAIARHIVDMHGGTIHVASDGQGKGSTFRVKLPLQIVHAEEHPEGDRVHPRSAKAGGPIPVSALEGVKVLAVDDDPDAQLMLRQILESAGATVQTAGSTAGALENLAMERPDVMVSDLGMPGMDGFELIERIRRSPDPRLRDIPAAALTAYARSEDRAKALRRGFNLHLAKPIDPAELIAAVGALARQRAGR